ncbi:hypothetical protein DITRI_Ditri13aG0059600 [Diplodiscus trichospermus]
MTAACLILRSPHMQQVDNSCSKWQKPSNSNLKCNVDAAVFESMSKLSFPFDHRSLSFREAFSWLKELHFDDIIVETDALAVINAISNNVVVDSSFGLIIADCISLVKEIPKCKVTFVCVNQVAYTLAQASCSMSGLGEWFDTPRAFILDVMGVDD